MIFKSRMLISILVLISIGFIVSAISSVQIAKELRLKRLTEQDLPLILDNAHSNIEKTLLKPEVIASMMASNSFLISWVEGDTKNIKQIRNYLSGIKKKYNLFTVFVALENHHQYFFDHGLSIFKRPTWANDNWYLKIKNSNNESEANLAYNHKNDKMIFYINNKMKNSKNKLLGIVGIGLNINKIDNELKNYSNVYGKNVYLLNTKGELLSLEKTSQYLAHVRGNAQLKRLALQLREGHKKLFTYYSNGIEYLVGMRFIKSLNLILCIDIPVKKATQPMLDSLVITIILGCFLLCCILYLIFKMMNKYQAKLEAAAWYDQLTGLLNRLFFIEKYSKEDERHLRSQRDMMLLMADIDNFKEVNDRLGHVCGDAVLVRCAQILHDAMRLTDVVSRWGGEEFMLLLPETSLKEAINVAQRLKNLIENDSHLISLTKRKITISIGLHIFCPGETMDWHFEMVDKNLYKAKKAGRNCIVY